MLKCLTKSFIIKKKKNVGVRIFNQNIRFSVLFENILFSLILERQSVNMDQTSLNFKILCGLRGFHVYSDKWKPRIGERISIVHEKRNIHDINAMAGKKHLPGTLAPSIIGHLPKEISRYTRYISSFKTSTFLHRWNHNIICQLCALMLVKKTIIQTKRTKTIP